MTKPRILFVLHLPPPMHGAALVGSFIRESGLVNSTFDTRYVNLSASSTLEEVGRFSLKKFRPVFRLIREVCRTVSEWKPDRVYLTPSATMPGLLKDALVARAARRKGARVILHFHNKGVAERQDRFVYDRLYRIPSWRTFADMQGFCWCAFPKSHSHCLLVHEPCIRYKSTS